jgi:hypothetical protein
MRAATALAAALAVLALAGCDDGSDAAGERATTTRHEGRSGPLPRPPAALAPASDLREIGAWADALRGGHVAAAARYFAVPALVRNSPPARELRTRAAVLRFNRSLPCGAQLVSGRRAGRYTIATFVLSERSRRGSCGASTGHRADVAMRLRRGRIVEWRACPAAVSMAAPSPDAACAARAR